MQQTASQVQPNEIIYLSVKDACRFAACGRSTLYNAMAAGEIKTAKRGRKRLIYVPSLLKWMDIPEAA